jgi:hypothetical protein
MRSDGTIVEVQDDEEAKRKNLIPVPEAERAKVEAMSPDERRDWYKAQQYRRERKNRKGRRQERNARKRQRKARRRLRASMKRRKK